MPSHPDRRRLFTGIKILLGLGLLYLALLGVDWGELGRSLAQVRWGWLAAGAATVLAGLFVKVWRWWLLLAAYDERPPFVAVCRAFFVGQAGNILLPVRGGEVLRLGWLSGARQAAWGPATISIVLEKYLDGIFFALAATLVSAWAPDDYTARWGVWPAVVSAAATLGLAVLVAAGPAVWRRLAPLLERRTPPSWRRWLGRGGELLAASQWLRRPERTLPLLALTALAWGIMASTNWLLFRALGLQAGWRAAGLVLVLVYVGLLPGLMPGNVGPFYFFARLALLPFGVDGSPALACAVLLHAVVTLPPLLLAAVFLFLPGGRRGGN